MSIQRMADTSEGLQLLKDIVDLVKNPKPLLDAHEAAKGIVALDSDTKAKVAQAQSIIRQADDITKVIEEKKSELKTLQSEFENNKSAFEKKKAEMESILKQREDSLAQSVKTFSDYEKKTREELENRAAHIDGISAGHAQIKADLDLREQNIKSGEIDLAHKLREVEKLKQELNEKAEEIRKKIAAF